MSAKKRKAERLSLVDLHQLEQLKKSEVYWVRGSKNLKGESCPRSCNCKLGLEDASAEVFIQSPDLTDWAPLI